MKRISINKIVLFSALLFISLFPVISSAAAITYTPLAPIPALYGGKTIQLGSGDNLALYLNNWVRILIAIATGLAVLYIVYGGVRYSLSESFSSKGEAENTIKNALLGLFLALGSYMILNTINPDLLAGKIRNLQDLSVEPIREGSTGISAVSAAGATGAAGLGSGGIGAGSSGLQTGLTGNGTIAGGSLDTLQETSDGYTYSTSNPRMDTDGVNPPPFNDPDWSKNTSYTPNGQSLDANNDPYVVVPDNSGIPLGTKVLIQDNTTGQSVVGIVGDHGGTKPYGEISLAGLKTVGAWKPGMGNSANPDNIQMTFYTK